MSKPKSFKSEKLSFYNWIFHWASNDNIVTEEVDIDTPQFVAILQSMGFKLETLDQVLTKQEGTNDTVGIKIEVKCNTSGIRAILSKKMEKCMCPSSETRNQGQFWIVSGAGPSTSYDNLNKIDETYSNLIPTLSKEKTNIIHDILSKICSTVLETDENQNKQLASHIEDTKNMQSLSDSSKPYFMRQDTWEVDPKTSPPTGTSSPLPESSNSTSSQSLNNDKEQILVDILLTVKENLEKALILLPHKNNTFTKQNVKRVSNIRVSPTVITPTRSTTSSSTSDFPLRKTPKKKMNNENKTKCPQGEKRNIVVTSKISSFRKKTDLLTPTGFKSKLVKKDCSQNLDKNASPSNSGILDRKNVLSSVGKNLGLKFSNTSPYANNPGFKHLKPKSGIPSFGFSSTTKTNINSPLKMSK